MNRQCLRQCVAFALQMKTEDVPDFVQSVSAQDWNRNWLFDLIAWAKRRGFGTCLISKTESGWPMIHEVMAIAVIPNAEPEGGHAVVVKVAVVSKEQQAVSILFDPDHPDIPAGCLMLPLRGSEIKQYILFVPIAVPQETAPLL